MKIDVRSPDGNTIVALGHATRLLKQVDRKSDADALVKAVFSAESAKTARDLITTATNGSIEFVGTDD